MSRKNIELVVVVVVIVIIINVHKIPQVHKWEYYKIIYSQNITIPENNVYSIYVLGTAHKTLPFFSLSSQKMNRQMSQITASEMISFARIAITKVI